MVKHTQTIRRQWLTNCLSVFDHFVGLALKDLITIVAHPIIMNSLTLNEGCESAIYISRILEELLEIDQIPILEITDNKSPDEVSNSLTATSDRLFRVEIVSINLKWVAGNKQLDD